METNQIYSLVNSVVAQGIGTVPITAVDTTTLISLGNVVISSNNNSEGYLNTLAQRIGRTIISYRKYRNKMGDMVLNDFEYGAILQKIKIGMPDAEPDMSYELEQGKSVDPWIINKPTVNQKLFVTRTPYDYHITVTRVMLKEAFLSAEAMNGFINYLFGEVRNKIELAIENLGRICIANFIAETTHVVNLVSDFNTWAGTTVAAGMGALKDEAFLRYAISRIKAYSKKLTDMTQSFNDGTVTRFTPFEDQRIKVWSEFQTFLETNVQYAAFHDNFVSLNGYQEVNFWQSSETPTTINVKRASDGTATTVENIVAVLYDRDALGMYREDEEVLTTPINARARYYNTYWHLIQLWFNDLSENFVCFTLN